MKFNRYNLFLIIMGMMAVTGCVTSTSVSTTTAPDGTKTVTETKTSGPDAASVNAASSAVTIAAGFIPRPRVIAEK